MEDIKVTDIHSHLIWGVDDGSRSLDMSLEMIRMGAAQGVSRIFCTPHFSSQFHAYTNENIKRKFEILREKAAGECELYLGQEIFAGSEVPDMLREGRLLTMANSRYVLVEFYPWENFYNMVKLVREMVMDSYRPILAHIERYKELSDLGKVEALIEQGAYMQMNLSDISGKFLDKTAAYCRNALENGLIHFLGTDMHDTAKRTPRLTEALKWMDKKLDEDYVRDICTRNADKIINDQRL
ncbi:MAG: protein tyrosine phosphatase [Lachnospiraceae bacterium]|nr:protein tyrosine phosphatase [Lachnospiraceae bacterium]